MSERRTVDELTADAEHARQATAGVPEALGQVRASAANAQGTVQVTVNARGELTGLRIADAALAAGPQALSAELMELTGQATKSALVQAIGVLAPAVGDAVTAQFAEAAGLGHLIEEAPVLPYLPGSDPNAASFAPPDGFEAAVLSEPDDDLDAFDWSSLRSDR